ncbi:MAG: hypothetical protein NTW59_03875 [Candidatus Diapherotrites archaeon]|nr:hypothetical protein [Candidatus Diapherotrites archaeon]
MPKLIYSISKTKAERERNRVAAAREEACGGYKNLVMLGTHSGPKRLTPFTVFDFLEKAFFGKTFGARAVYTTERTDGKCIGYTYEKAPNSYCLVERRDFPLGGGAPKIEKIPVPKRL